MAVKDADAGLMPQANYVQPGALAVPIYCYEEEMKLRG